MHRRIRIIQARSAAELEAVDRLRKEVFLDEKGYCAQSIERERGILADANRQAGLFLAMFDGEAVGTIAVDWWRGLDVDDPSVRHYRMQPFADAYGAASLVTARKWLVKRQHRIARVGFSLLRRVAAFIAARAEIQFVIIDCSPQRVRGYGALGFRHYASPFRYEADQATAVPLCLVASDLEHLRSIRSPAYKLLAQEGQVHRPDVASFFASMTSDAPDSRRRRVRA